MLLQLELMVLLAMSECMYVCTCVARCWLYVPGACYVLLTKNVARCRIMLLLLLCHNVKETAKSRNMFSDVWNKQFSEMPVVSFAR